MPKTWDQTNPYTYHVCPINYRPTMRNRRQCYCGTKRFLGTDPGSPECGVDEVSPTQSALQQVPTWCNQVRWGDGALIPLRALHRELDNQDP